MVFPVTCVEDDCKELAVGITAYCKRHHHDNWHGWFAWYPVLTLSGEWAWFSTVIRKRIRPTPHYDKPVVLPWQTTFWYRVPDDWL